MYYPLNLNLEDRRCLVVGGGPVAERKVESLIAAGARVVVVAETAVDSLRARAAAGEIELHLRRYEAADLDSTTLAYAATENEDLHRRIAADARARGVLLNVVDRPHWCDFIVPSIARRGDLVISVSTSGRSPAMARRLRLDLERAIGPEYERTIDLFDRLRRDLTGRGWSLERRKRVFDELLETGVLDAVRETDSDAVDRLLTRHTGGEVSVASLGWGES